MSSEEDDDDEFLYSEGELDDAESDGVDWEDVAPSHAAAVGDAEAPEASEPAKPAPKAQYWPSEASGEPEGTRDAALNDGNSDDEDADDIVWESATQEEAEAEPDASMSDGNDSGAEEVADLGQVDWAEVNRSLEQEARAEEAAAEKKRKRRRAVRMTKEDKDRELALHQSHLLILLALHLEWNKLSQSPLLRGLMLSLTSVQTFDFFADMKTHPLSYSLELLVRWFHREFAISATAAADDDYDDVGLPFQKPLLSESRLMAVFFERKGTEYELAVLFTTLCRALRLHCRHVCALDPLVVRSGSSFFEATATGRPSQRDPRRQQYERKKRLRTALSPGQGIAATTGEDAREAVDSDGGEVDGERRRRRQFYWVWTEVLDESTKTWTHVDAVRRVVGRPRDVEALRGKSAPFSYVVALYETGRVLDVTSRYANTWSKTLTLRLADAWLEVAIGQVNRQLESNFKPLTSFEDQIGGGMTLAEVDELLADETRRLQAMKMSEAMPTALEAFRKHHVYCLERHLGRFECVHPRKAVGVFNGEPVFLRASVQRVQSAFKWRRLGREVTDIERSTPARWYNPNNRKRSGGGDDGDDETLDADEDGASRSSRAGSLGLFGLWQTTEIVPPAVVDGVLPKNRYGNIEVWSPAHVPRGAVHLRLPHIEQVAKQLGVDYAQAVVGFERQGPMGRTAPQIDGIVVVKAIETMLVDAHADIQQSNIERAIEKNQRIAARRWERLVKRLLLRQRLEDDYGKV